MYFLFVAEGMSEDEAKKILSEHAEKYHVKGATSKMSWFQKFIEYQVCMLFYYRKLTNHENNAS